MNRIRVAVNGYGVIGKRVADAVRLQDDMVLAGVADIINDYRLQVAARAGLPVHAATPQAEGPMRAAGISVAGGLADLLAKSTSSSTARRRRWPRSTKACTRRRVSKPSSMAVNRMR